MNTRQTTERQIFAQLYANPKLYFDHSIKLTADIFQDGQVKIYFDALSSLMQKNIKVNSYSIAKELKQPSETEGVISIVQMVDYDTHFESLVDFVFEESKKDKIRKIITDASIKLNSNDESDEISDLIQKGLISLMNIKKNSVKHISEGLTQMNDNIEKNLKSDGITGIKTGLKDFDEFSGGLQTTDLIVLAGNTSMGKTSLAITIGKNVAADENVPVAIFSLEMNTLQLVSRISSMESEIDSKHLLRGRLYDHQITKLNNSISRLYSAPLFIDECSTSSLTGIINSIHALVMQEGIKVVIIDYLQLVNNSGKGKNKEQEVAEIARALKNTAKSLDVCIILLSQLSRANNSRGGDKRPMLSDLRDSGQIEEAADIVMFVYRSEYYGIEQDESGESTIGMAELIIAKGRSIGLTTIDLRFDKHLTRFRNKTEDKVYQVVNNDFKPSDLF